MNADTPTLTVVIDQRLAAYRGGGIARYALELGAALERLSGVEVVPLRHRRDESAPGNAVRLRTPAHHRREEWLIGAEMLARRVQADVYHATDFVAPRLLGTPVVATVHDLAFLRWPAQLDRDALGYYMRLRKRRHATARWIVPSEWTKRDLCGRLGIDPGKVTVIPHGVPGFVGQQAPIARDQRRPFILAVGTIEPRKCYDLLLDGFEAAGVPYSLCIAGRPGWNTGALQRRLSTTPDVTWLPDAGDDDVRSLLRKATALAVPSIAEGFGLPALEAMASGTPVISSGHGALPEVTGPAALQPVTDNISAWSAAIERIVTDEDLWERLSSRGLARSRDFTWERAAHATLEVYREATGSSRP